MKKPAPGDQPEAEGMSAAETTAALTAPAEFAPKIIADTPPVEELPVAGGSYIRLPDGTLQREQEA